MKNHVDNECIHPNRLLRHARFNPETQQTDFYFPMEIEDPIDKEYAKLMGFEIGWTMLGFRVFEAIMVPCMNKTHDAAGREIYLPTPAEEQHRIYKSLIKDEMDRQEEMKEDGRCPLPSKYGGTRRCPLRIKNPNYVPGGTEPKTIANKCEGCPFEQYRQEHSFVQFSTLEVENDAGEPEPFEVPAPATYYAADQYEQLAQEFVAFVTARKPKLAPLVEKLMEEYTKSDAARELGDAWGTITSRTDKLKLLMEEFLNQAIIF